MTILERSLWRPFQRPRREQKTKPSVSVGVFSAGGVFHLPTVFDARVFEVFLVFRFSSVFPLDEVFFVLNRVKSNQLFFSDGVDGLQTVKTSSRACINTHTPYMHTFGGRVFSTFFFKQSMAGVQQGGGKCQRRHLLSPPSAPKSSR